MAGYSPTPLSGKLGLKPGTRAWLINPPSGFEHTLNPLPAGLELAATARGPTTFDVILLFAPRAAALHRNFDRARARLAPAGGLWIAWPKKTSGVPTDLTEDVIRDLGLAAGLVDNKVCAIDDTWSGLRLVVRLKDRPRPGPARSSGSARARPVPSGPAHAGRKQRERP